MKKGKSVKLKLFQPIKSVYGTVDSKNLKSLYINIQSWVTPKDETDNWNRVVCNLSREIKHSVFNSIDTEIFQEQSIVDLDLRTSGISTGKKSFFNLEVNLFIKFPLDFKSKELKDSIKSIIKTIYKNNISNNNYFDFTVSKKSEVINSD
jgi:tRNA nucleotidyltransferase (CCA-adding enzyme)